MVLVRQGSVSGGETFATTKRHEEVMVTERAKLMVMAMVTVTVTAMMMMRKRIDQMVMATVVVVVGIERWEELEQV